MTNNFQFGDLKFYYGIHVNKQRSLGNTPVRYDTFTRRLKKMNLHDAIYTPRVEYNVRTRARTPIQDNIRRMYKLKEEKIQILDLDELMEIETDLKQPAPKENIFSRFISLFNRKG